MKTWHGITFAILSICDPHEIRMVVLYRCFFAPLTANLMNLYIFQKDGIKILYSII